MVNMHFVNMALSFQGFSEQTLWAGLGGERCSVLVCEEKGGERAPGCQHNWVVGCTPPLAYPVGQGWATGGPGATCAPHLHLMRPSG